MPGVHNLRLYRGDTKALRFEMFSDAAAESPVDLDGATVAAEIREKSAGVYVVELTVEVVLPNVVFVTMTPEMFESCPTKGVWDLQITWPDDTVETAVAGAVTVRGDVTDSLVMVGG